MPAPVMGAGERGSCGIHMRRRVSEQRIIECNFQRIHNCKGSFPSKQTLSVLRRIADAYALTVSYIGPEPHIITRTDTPYIKFTR